ncbi:DUF2155 domain-containing protein [Sandarakinorhabdus sp. AAP62]|uniref:DUF2155 domain-containing protein n=1 Tax=Sandarakinorhabdus sp. AAP62 TaxID=1248916 RepID=UPI0012671A3A|nr:DUF2155 domain-containing protein [Sandarakinorhabdus sp. AAP62]
MRRHPEALALAAVLLAGAVSAQETAPAAAPPAVAAPAPPRPAAPRVLQVTPVKERVLVVGALAKRTGETRFLTLKPGQYLDFAGIRITARTCETTPPWEWPKLQGAFLQVDERLAGQVKRVFSGWLYAESPSLNVMQHPRYDVWLKSCTMRFPDGPSPKPPSSPAKKSPAAPDKAALN